MENRNKELEGQLQQLRGQENYEITSLKEHIRQLEQQVVPQSMESSVFLSADEEILKQKSIHNTEIRKKEETIRQLREELAAYKESMSEQELYMKIASLKKDIKQKDKEIETHRKQILNLSNHAEQNKEQH